MHAAGRHLIAHSAPPQPSLDVFIGSKEKQAASRSLVSDRRLGGVLGGLAQSVWLVQLARLQAAADLNQHGRSGALWGGGL